MILLPCEKLPMLKIYCCYCVLTRDLFAIAKFLARNISRTSDVLTRKLLNVIRHR